MPAGRHGRCAMTACNPAEQSSVVAPHRRPMDAQSFDAGGTAEIDAEFSFARRWQGARRFTFGRRHGGGDRRHIGRCKRRGGRVSGPKQHRQRSLPRYGAGDIVGIALEVGDPRAELLALRGQGAYLRGKALGFGLDLSRARRYQGNRVCRLIHIGKRKLQTLAAGVGLARDSNAASAVAAALPQTSTLQNAHRARRCLRILGQLSFASAVLIAMDCLWGGANHLIENVSRIRQSWLSLRCLNG